MSVIYFALVFLNDNVYICQCRENYLDVEDIEVILHWGVLASTLCCISLLARFTDFLFLYFECFFFVFFVATDITFDGVSSAVKFGYFCLCMIVVENWKGLTIAIDF